MSKANDEQRIAMIKRIMLGLKRDLDNNRISESSYNYLIQSFEKDLKDLGAK